MPDDHKFCLEEVRIKDDNNNSDEFSTSYCHVNDDYDDYPMPSYRHDDGYNDDDELSP